MSGNPAETLIWSGAEALTPLLQRIDELILLPGNPRQGDVGAISQSLERFGQQKPIVVNDDRVILAGNHTYLAASALGWTHIAVVPSELEGSDQAGFALADNRLSDLASYDNEALVAMLTEAGDLAGTGYSQDDRADLLLDIGQPLTFEPLDADSLARLDERKSTCHNQDCPHVCSE